ncbi:MAG TPA: hypothetical protein VGM26_14295 [Rhizomicrobium sp.]|jgi:hypothetical protein
MKFKMFSADQPAGIVKDVNDWLAGETGIAIRHTETKFTMVEPQKPLLLFSVWYDE